MEGRPICMGEGGEDVMDEFWGKAGDGERCG